jgi:hypothetical protein
MEDGQEQADAEIDLRKGDVSLQLRQDQTQAGRNGAGQILAVILDSEAIQNVPAASGRTCCYSAGQYQSGYRVLIRKTV